MPTGRRKDATVPESVPSAGDPDRKRVLNVLAQRRYRQRRREKIAALEAQAEKQSPLPSAVTAVDGGQPAGMMLPDGTATTWSPDLLLENQVDVVQVVPDTFELPVIDFGIGDDVLDEQLLEDFNNSYSHSPSSASNSSTSLTHHTNSTPQFALSGSTQFPNTPPRERQRQQQQNQHQQQPFLPMSPDGAKISVPILSAMRAAMTVVQSLNLDNLIWDLDYVHVFPATQPYHHLPPNLHPTPAQLTVPHHPFLDMLPWPSVRETLICMLAMPSAFRPPICRGEHDEPHSVTQVDAVQRMMAHMDDFREGIRVHGNMVGWGGVNELGEEAWEMGECFYRNWWWCVDEASLKHTNRRRRERGLGPLRIKG